MSTIFLDPVQMDTTAGHIGEHVNQVTTLVADLETACSAVVPASLGAWLTQELHDIAVTVRMIALLYAVAALDTAQRAQQIQADQSLATAAPALASTSATFTGAPLVGGIAPFATSTATTGFLAGSSLASGLVYEGMPAVTFGPPTGLLLGASGPNTPLGGYTPSSGGGSSGLSAFDIPGYASTNTLLLSTPGRTYLGNGVYEGSGITGSFHAVLPDPGHDY